MSDIVESEYMREMERGVRDWICEVLGESDKETPIGDWLKDGTRLCE